MGQVSDDHLRGLVEEGLTRQGEPHGARWAPWWGELVETAWAQGRVERDQWERYCRQAFPAKLALFPQGAEPSVVGCVVGPTRTGGTEAAPYLALVVVEYQLKDEPPVTPAEQRAWIRVGPSSQMGVLLLELPRVVTGASARVRLEALGPGEKVITSWEQAGACAVMP
ncbi:MAG TPA: hypothetical protein VD997_16810 [Phycisphaerales bacterium]|nr:hypothetical protein [Phycisphaerales bacterium]